MDHEKIYKIVKALVSEFPGGGTLAEFVALFYDPITKRNEEWMRSIAEGLAGLEARLGERSISNLIQDEQFISAFLQATHAALKTHVESKRAALRNALLNTAITQTASQSEIDMYLNIVDSLTPFHIEVLRFVADPASKPTWEAFQLELAEKAARDLEAGGLIVPKFTETRVYHRPRADGKSPFAPTRLARQEIREIEVESSKKEFFWRNYGGAFGVVAQMTPMGRRFTDFISTPPNYEDSETPPAGPAERPDRESESS